MAIVEYTAKRSMIAGRAANERVTIELDITECLPDVICVRANARSPGGAVEPSFERLDTFWTIAFAPVKGFSLALLREFMDSTESGEGFRVFPWDNDTAPLILKRCDDSGHSEDAFMLCGAEDKDYFTGQVRALQIAPYDPSGAGVASGGVGGGAGSGETTDIYAPEVGGPTGGLDPEDEDDGPVEPIEISLVAFDALPHQVNHAWEMVDEMNYTGEVDNVNNYFIVLCLRPVDYHSTPESGVVGQENFTRRTFTEVTIGEFDEEDEEDRLAHTFVSLGEVTRTINYVDSLYAPGTVYTVSAHEYVQVFAYFCQGRDLGTKIIRLKSTGDSYPTGGVDVPFDLCVLRNVRPGIGMVHDVISDTYAAGSNAVEGDYFAGPVEQPVRQGGAVVAVGIGYGVAEPMIDEYPPPPEGYLPLPLGQAGGQLQVRGYSTHVYTVYGDNPVLSSTAVRAHISDPESYPPYIAGTANHGLLTFALKAVLVSP